MVSRRARVKIAIVTLSGNSPRQTVHTHSASVHQAAKLVAALLRVAGVTAGLAENNGSLKPGLWLTSPAGWLPRTGISSRTLGSVIKYGLPLPLPFTFSLHKAEHGQETVCFPVGVLMNYEPWESNIQQEALLLWQTMRHIMSVKILWTVETSCTTNPQQIEVGLMELESYRWPTTSKQPQLVNCCIGVVDKLDHWKFCW